MPGTNGYRAYIMTIVADSAYSQKGFAQFNKNNYAQKDTAFSGRVLYYTPKGEFTSGYIIKNGLTTQIETVEQKSKEIQSLKTNLLPDPGSQPGPVQEVPPQTCTNWYVDRYEDGVLISL